MTWIATAVIAVSTIISSRAQKKAVKRARKQADKDAVAARKAELFAETEGEGIGELGQISLEVDDDLDDEEISRRQGSTVRI